MYRVKIREAKMLINTTLLSEQYLRTTHLRVSYSSLSALPTYHSTPLLSFVQLTAAVLIHTFKENALHHWMMNDE
jgi:hypothetical protein